jgi:cobalt-zinc-cadmium efflux system outer membrane protein
MDRQARLLPDRARRTKFWRASTFASALFFFNFSAPAQTKLTLEQALSLAEDYHPLLRAGIARIEGAQAGITTSRAYPNPQFGVIAGQQTIRVPGNVAGLSQFFTFSQPLELGPLRPARQQVAQLNRQSNEYLLAGTRISVLSSVRRAFYQVLRRRAEIDVLTENLRLVEELRKRIQVRVEVGEAGRLELVRADAELVAARSAANSARLQYISSLTQLRTSVGSTLDADLTVEGQLDPFVALPPLDTLRQQALDSHPGMAYLRSEIKRFEANVSYEVAQRRPQPQLVAEIERPPDSPSYRVGVSIPINLWNRREGPIAEAAAQVRAVTAQAQNRELEFVSGIESAYARYNLATQQLAAFEQGLFVEATEAVRAAEVAYRLGERGILEVLDAQRVLRTVRLDFLNAQYDRQAALIDLDELRARDLRRNIP